MTGLFIALRFLTRLPTPAVAPEAAGELARAAPWLPIVGALVGALVALAVALGTTINPWIGALLGLVTGVAVTGGLHVEGLGDVADGMGAAHGNPDRFVEVARDPHLGSFGAIAIALQLAAKLVLLAALAERATLSDVLEVVDRETGETSLQERNATTSVHPTSAPTPAAAPEKKPLPTAVWALVSLAIVLGSLVLLSALPAIE